MPRPFTDIQAAISGNAVKNGSLIVSTTFTGQHSVNDLYTKNYIYTKQLQNVVKWISNYGV